MDERTVNRKDLEALIDRIARERAIVGPVADRTGIRYEEIEDPGSLELAAGNGPLSPKGALFPQVEALFRFSPDGFDDAREPSRETILFGVRPCDARALTLLERVFRGNEIDDPYFVGRRSSTTVVSLACFAPGPACFCTSVGGGPADPTGSDLVIFDLDERLLLRPVTDRGERLLAEAEATTRPAAKQDLEEGEARAERAAKGMEAVSVPTDLAALRRAFDAPVWDAFAATCLGCGACAYVCPTCHCFDVTDEGRKGTGRRVRSWDSCAFSRFTLHGSGHNPRETQASRLRQRILHKFLYCPENFDEVFCVGCGRCIAGCPSGIDLRSILESLAAPAAGGGG